MSLRLIGGIVLALALAPVATAWAGGSAKGLSKHPIRVQKQWRGYVEAPQSSFVRPVRVLGVTGDVINPQGLANGGQTTLNFPGGGPQPSLILDFGKDVGGIASFDVAASTPTTLQASYSETLANLGSDDSAVNGLFSSGNPSRTDSFGLGGAGTVTGPQIQGGERYVHVTLAGPGTATLNSAGIYFSALRQTADAMRGHFLSSDEVLNRIWYAGAYTLNLNQLPPGAPVQGAVNRLHLILDGAKRDRAVWSGDHLISALTDYYTGDPVYGRDSLALLLEHPATVANVIASAQGDMARPGPLPGACSPNPATGNSCFTWSASYSMATIIALYNYYLYSGDIDFVRNHWPAVIRQMAWDAGHVASNGLFEVNADEGADWNTDTHAGQLTYVNAMYSLALQSAGKLALALGQKAYGNASLAAANRLRVSVNTQIWDPISGVYDPSTTQRGPFVVQDANATAILAGIPKPVRARQILSVMQATLDGPFGPRDVSSPVPGGYSQLTSPYMSAFHVLADFKMGDTNDALANIRKEWGYMLTHDPGGVFWERIENSGLPGRGLFSDSAAHAWSSGPTAALSQYVLGVEPRTAGYRQWSVAPQPGDLSWAQGAVPTPRGSIAVRWIHKGGAFVLTVKGPKRGRGFVTIPGARHGTIARNGRVVWNHGKRAPHVRARAMNGDVIFQQGGGRATYAFAGKGGGKKHHKKK